MVVQVRLLAWLLVLAPGGIQGPAPIAGDVRAGLDLALVLLVVSHPRWRPAVLTDRVLVHLQRQGEDVIGGQELPGLPTGTDAVIQGGRDAPVPGDPEGAQEVSVYRVGEGAGDKGAVGSATPFAIRDQHAVTRSNCGAPIASAKARTSSTVSFGSTENSAVA